MAYRTSAPMVAFYSDRDLDLERALHELRRTGSERVFLIAPGIFNQENLADKMPRLSVYLDFFAKAGLETGVWIGQTIGHGGGFEVGSGGSLRDRSAGAMPCWRVVVKRNRIPRERPVP